MLIYVTKKSRCDIDNLCNNRIGSNELMGCTAIGSNAIGIGKEHWSSMLESPREPQTQWYPLLDSVTNHIQPIPTERLPISLSCINSR